MKLAYIVSFVFLFNVLSFILPLVLCFHRVALLVPLIPCSKRITFVPLLVLSLARMVFVLILVSCLVIQPFLSYHLIVMFSDSSLVLLVHCFMNAAFILPPAPAFSCYSFTLPLFDTDKCSFCIDSSLHCLI